MTEEWKPVVGWEGFYEVSDHGRVRRLERSVTDSVGRVRVYPEVILNGRVDSLGYHRHKLRRAPRKAEPKTHQLVAWTFLGPQPKGLDICHNDGNKLNNRLGNLRYDTRKGNSADRVLHGTDFAGAKNPAAVLTEGQVRLVRRLKGKGCNAALAEAWGVSTTSLYYIQNGKSWRHLK